MSLDFIYLMGDALLILISCCWLLTKMVVITGAQLEIHRAGEVLWS